MNELDLMNEVAKSMNCSIVKWDNVDEAINKNIEIFKLVDSSNYTTTDEYKKLKQKSFVGK